jgi:hypothetical protein
MAASDNLSDEKSLTLLILYNHHCVTAAHHDSTAGRRPAPQQPDLILFAEGLGVCLAVRIEEFFAALLPRRFEFRRGDVPVRPAFPENGAKILSEFRRAAPPGLIQ